MQAFFCDEMHKIATASAGSEAKCFGGPDKPNTILICLIFSDCDRIMVRDGKSTGGSEGLDGSSQKKRKRIRKKRIDSTDIIEALAPSGETEADLLLAAEY